MLRSLAAAALLGLGLAGSAHAACFGAPGIASCVDMGRQYVLSPAPSDPTTVPLDPTIGLSMILQAQSQVHSWAAEMYIVRRNQHMLAYGQYSWMCVSAGMNGNSRCISGSATPDGGISQNGCAAQPGQN